MRDWRRGLDWIGKKHLVILAIIAVATLSGVYSYGAGAACYNGRVLGRSCYRGYFTNTQTFFGTVVLPPIRNDQALPEDQITNADALYHLLYSAYTSGDNQKHTGAAFIYNTMMGNRAPGIGKNISNTQWEDLHQRLVTLDKAGKIRWHGNVSADINSYWQGPDADDDAFYQNFKDETGIEIRDYNNNVIYKLLRRCANPIGNTQGLPPAKNYTLSPHVDSISPSTAEPGGKISVRTGVDNNGETASQTTQWEITQITVLPGKKAPHEDQAGTVSPEAPCQSGGGSPVGTYFQSSDASCKNAAKGSGSFDLGSPAQNLKPSASGIDVGDLPVGTRVCFALSVQPHSSLDGNWAHSRPICTIVGKMPKVQVWGGDLAVRGQIETSTSVKDIGGVTRTFGSWVEYGAFSVGVNNRFASGSGLSGGNPDNNQAVWSKLTFANKDVTGQDAFGNYTNAGNFRALSGIAAYFKSFSSSTPVGNGHTDLSSLASNTGDPIQVRTAGDLTITGAAIPAGKSVVIVASGTVTIDGDIAYTDATLHSLRDLPQVVIIAGNIAIKDSVGQVDAWLVASDTINTCYNFSGSLTSNKCNKALVVNGPVVTNKLILNRTAGADTGNQSGDPAERFNLRPDAYLWAQLQAIGRSRAETVYQTELPPRF